MTDSAHPPVVLRGRRLPTDRAAVMAIVNRTPDSFYDGGRTPGFDAAIDAVRRAVADGADLVDIGGVKAGAGAPVSIAEETTRVVPLVERLRSELPDVVISVDTWRAEVAAAACEAGAHLINDTWAGADPRLLEVAARFGTGMVCSHTGGMRPRSNPHRVGYRDVVATVLTEVTAAAERAVAAGVPRAGVLVDPTHDFGKNTHHSLELLHRADELVASGWPVLMALSRKDFVGETLAEADRPLPPDDRLAGTLAATAVAARAGVAVVRAHDVRATRQVVDMVASIGGTRPPARPLRGVI
ncbi:dihydropteroate synthase [Nakamurella aerolata]|uniref:Dihydropteroate synthase n=1 Tax=Nakamurella aerolata TaxID=1656892 RepID=A0A849A4B8_9ACTN|nr:dihydropteroate synthase [Nakamurella aerolata]NNG34173.1 dihydropteroate synthase [Nakamurella aerolata]